MIEEATLRQALGRIAGGRGHLTKRSKAQVERLTFIQRIHWSHAPAWCQILKPDTIPTTIQVVWLAVWRMSMLAMCSDEAW